MLRWTLRQARQHLAQELAAEDSRTCVAAIQQLGNSGDPRAVEPLLAHLSDSSEEEVRQAAAAALLQLGPAAVPPLRACLADRNGSVRQAAAELLAQLGWRPHTPQERALDAVARGRWDEAVRLRGAAFEPLLVGLTDPSDGEVRRTAALALGRLGDARAVAPLLARLADSYSAVQAAAGTALVQLGPPAVPPLRARLADSNAAVRRGAATALGHLGDGRAVAPLLVCLADSDGGVRRGAATALGQLGDARAIGALVRCANTDPEVAPEAIQALARLLEQQRASVRDEDLRAVVALEYGAGATARGAAPLREPTMLAGARVRELAQQELIRRGAQV